MAASTISTGSAAVIAPTITSEGNYIFDSTALAAFQSLIIPASSSIIDELTLALTPILSMSTVNKIDSFNLFIQTTADDTAADTWTMHWIPVWLAQTTPYTPNSSNIFHVFTPQDAGTLVESRTHPSNTDTVDTLMHVSTSTTATIIGGGGSEVSVIGSQKVAITAPYLMLNLVAGSTSEITINTLNIWGSRREA